MIRFPRIVVTTLATVLLLIPPGMSEEFGEQLPISADLAAPRIIRVQNTQCRRTCDTDYDSCMHTAEYAQRNGGGMEAYNKMIEQCMRFLKQCYRNC